jgi:hypothetical protein
MGDSSCRIAPGGRATARRFASTKTPHLARDDGCAAAGRHNGSGKVRNNARSSSVISPRIKGALRKESIFGITVGGQLQWLAAGPFVKWQEQPVSHL